MRFLSRVRAIRAPRLKLYAAEMEKLPIPRSISRLAC